MGLGIVGIAILIFIIVILKLTVHIVPESELWIVEDLGKARNIPLQPGLNFIMPFYSNIRAKVSTKRQTMDVPPQKVITKDNVTVEIDTVIFYQITDPLKAVYQISNLKNSISYLCQTTIRDIIGKMELDSILSARNIINDQLRDVLDLATDPWGCKVERVEIKEIDPPRDIKDSMEKQMNAERTKRSSILLAEGEKESAIRIAEGQRESKILEADAEKEANIKRAEGIRQAKILEATGEAEAIERIAEAKSKEIEMVYAAIKNSNPDDKLVALKTLESLEKVADGKANKVFIPFEATKTLATLGSLKEITKD